MRTYSDETKAAVVAAIASGTAMGAAARQWGIPKSTVRFWLRQAGQVSPRVTPEKRADLGELIGRYLIAGLETLEAQARLAADPAYLRQQPAGELAILHGVIADKLVKILSGFEPDDGPPLLDAAPPPDAPRR